MSSPAVPISPDFASIHNYYERPVLEAVAAVASHYPLVEGELLADVACVALNRLPPRYIRHDVDLAFYLTEKERADNEKAVGDAVRYAFEFVQARRAMRAR
ncbi:MAG TPA: late competence development ComFB family protein [Burkholderiaceae bacterium]|nr:late competence development ComFB family protein [Burkholderiaceae bacterium]